MKLINIYDAVRAVDRHMLEDGTLDNDISCILEEVTPVMIPQKASSSCSHEKDTISRQAAIDALMEILDRPNHAEFLYTDEICKALKALPSAQQERKKGKWIYNSPVTMKCNQCGFVIKDWDWHRFKYCPNCIADMRGEQDG